MFDTNHLRLVYNDEGLSTSTSNDQIQVEKGVQRSCESFHELLSVDPDQPILCRDAHATYLRKGIVSLGKPMESLDASRPWLCYWIMHSMELLEEPIPEEVGHRVVELLRTCAAKNGGYGGGPGQSAHLATTYAAVMTLCIIGTEAAYASINVHALALFLQTLKQPDGSFVMHLDGEVDIRGVYCAAAVVALLNISTQPLFDGSPEWIACCQTYEGGFAAEPGAEAHGGYTYCGLAALILLGHSRLCDVDSLMRWLSRKQMPFEGGFQGRTNKLVDGCYSFWQAATWPLIHQMLQQEQLSSLSASKEAQQPPSTALDVAADYWLFDREALQRYILICCQCPSGGLVDKPGKSRDYYHTCYTLSGLAIAQHGGPSSDVIGQIVLGTKSNLLKQNHPLFNICLDSEQRARDYWCKSQCQ